MFLIKVQYFEKKYLKLLIFLCFVVNLLFRPSVPVVAAWFLAKIGSELVDGKKYQLNFSDENLNF